MKKTLVTLSLLTLGLSNIALAQTENYTVDSSHTYPQFSVSHLGFSIQRGQFQNTTGTVALDLEKRTGSVDIKVDTNSLNSGFAKRDEHLKGDAFFNVQKFPAITFKSKKLVFSGKTLKSVEGDLTLLGVTKPVTLAVSHFHSGVNPISQKATVGAEASAKIKRSDYGMKTFLPAVGDDITINIQIEANK